MFIQFFTALRQTGISVTPGEWLCFQEALDRGMANNSLQAFYYLARMILVKRETDFDAFDQVFERLFFAETRPGYGDRRPDAALAGQGGLAGGGPGG